MKCRACNSGNIFNGIVLGNIPIAGGFIKNIKDSYKNIETNMVVCASCGLGQTSVDLNPSDLFVEYNWRTSTSKSYLEYSKNYCKQLIDKYEIKPSDWILEIASNDGYMLSNFKNFDIDVLGVDPAKNIAMYAITSGIPTITDFFGNNLALKILEQKGYPKLIIANNVMAHVPDIQDFVKGLSTLCSEETIISVENPTIMNILQKDHFDTIFHEHYSYLSANSVNNLVSKYDLVLFDLESVDVHGGSNRYLISKNKKQSERVNKTIEQEIKDGLFSPTEWNKTYQRIKSNIEYFKNKINKINGSGGIVCGYTASAKSTIILNFAKIEPGQIRAIADDVKEKQDHFMAGLNIPITDFETMLSYRPTDIIVFSWNIYDDIKKKIEDVGYVANIWKWNDK